MNDLVAPWEEDAPARDASSAPVLSIEGFEGPLDWLLEMAGMQRIELAKLSILALVEAFMQALDDALAQRQGTPFDLARWGDWTVMAAHIALLRSRLLLPPDAPEARAAQEEAEAWRHQLLTRAAIRSAADWLARQPQLGRDVFARGQPETGAAGQRRSLDITDLFRACLVALRLPEYGKAFRPLPPRLWLITDAIGRIRRMLGEGWGGGELRGLLPRLRAGPEHELRCRAAVASTLVAGLELAREGALGLEQRRPWYSVRVRRL